MGNRISDIGRMRSKVASQSRMNLSAAQGHPRLGTVKNPAVVSVKSEARSKEVKSIFEEHKWEYRIEVDLEKPEDIHDLNRLLNPQKPKIAERKVGRNEPCLCGSGKKSKHCCAHSKGDEAVRAAQPVKLGHPSLFKERIP